MKRPAAFALPILVALSPGSFAQIVLEPTLSADAALDVAAGALAQCRKEGQKVSVTVVDAAGRVKASVRDDGASPHSSEHSLRKAYTALTYRMPSADYGKRAAESKGVEGTPKGPGSNATYLSENSSMVSHYFEAEFVGPPALSRCRSVAAAAAT